MSFAFAKQLDNRGARSADTSLRLATDLYSRLMNYAFNALSRRSMTEFEMRDKLIERLEKIQGSSSGDAGEDVIANVCDRLKELNLINDERYLVDFIAAKTSFRAMGKFGVFHKLRGKGISKEVFDRAWERASISEMTILDKACEDFKRKKGAIRGERKQKERLMRYLAGRGFPPDLIYRKMRQCD